MKNLKKILFTLILLFGTHCDVMADIMQDYYNCKRAFEYDKEIIAAILDPNFVLPISVIDERESNDSKITYLTIRIQNKDIQIASAEFSITLNKRTKNKDCYLEWLGTHRDYQHKGIGSKVLRAVSDHAQNQQCKEVSLYALEHAKPFYKKFESKDKERLPLNITNS
jgi:N-acetylglutamate synthase-like GNAT family acetyltransferase